MLRLGSSRILFFNLIPLPVVTYRGFNKVFSRRATGFDRLAKLFEVKFVIREKPSSKWANQAGKVILKAGQFAQCSAQPLIKTPEQ